MTMDGRESSHRGFASIAALFVLLVLAGLGAFVAWTSATQNISSAQDVLGARAYWAARAGVEWAVGSLAASATPTASPTACPAPPSPFTIDGFNVTIVCSVHSYDEAGASAPLRLFRVESIASAGGTVGSLSHVERSLSATLAY